MLIIPTVYAVSPLFHSKHFFPYKFMDIYSFNRINMLINSKYILLAQTSAPESYN